MTSLRVKLGVLTGAAALAAAGMLGILGLGASASAPSASAPTVGTVPPDAFTAQGVDLSKVPDYIPVVDHSGAVVGYARKQDLFAPPPPGASGTSAGPTTQAQQQVQATSATPVYGPDLATVVGWVYPGRGFVPLGQSPALSPTANSTLDPTVTPTTIAR